MEKRHIFWSILSIMMVAMLSIGLSSCSKDDDDDGGSGGGSKAAVVDGKAYNMKYAWWRVNGSGKSKHLTLEFSSIDIYNRDYIYAQPQIRAQFIDLEIGNWEYSDVQSGTYTGGLNFDDSEAKGYSDETHEWQSIQYHTLVEGKVKVVITRDGDDFTITIPETMIDSYDVNTEKRIASVPFSFTYKGKISVAGDWEN